MAIDEFEGDGRRVADITSGLQGLKHEARLKELKYLELLWLRDSEAGRNYPADCRERQREEQRGAKRV